jgi:adenylate cyclase
MMGREIERKFRVVDDSWRLLVTKTVHIVQGYLSTSIDRVVRVRTLDDQGALTIKGITSSSARAEYEYEIPLNDARQILRELCHQPLVEKTRSYIPQGELKWEIDVFHAPQDHLVIAEIELPSVDHPFEKPAWVGEDVTGDPRFYNQNITFRRP